MAPGSSLSGGPISGTVCAPRNSLAGVRWGALAALLTSVILVVAGCGGSHPRTELLKSEYPRSSDIYVRITGPGGAVSHIGQRFITAGNFSEYRLRKDPRGGFFVPPRILDRKLCASTHIIRNGDAPDLQAWRGRTLEITIYGKKSSAIFCAALRPGLYQAGS